MLAPVKQDMLDTYDKLKGKVDNFGPVLDALTEVDGLWNTSKFDIPKLLDDPDNIRDNLQAYIASFSPEAREILDRFEFASQITRLHKSGLLYLVLGKFAEIDLHPDHVSNLEMGYVHLAIAQKNGTERVVAIDAYRSRVDADLGHELSKAITWVRESLGI